MHFSNPRTFPPFEAHRLLIHCKYLDVYDPSLCISFLTDLKYMLCGRTTCLWSVYNFGGIVGHLGRI